MEFLEILKAILFGIVEGISEWLPISSTGHIILLNDLLPLNFTTPGFYDFFEIVIQLGAILAVILLFFKKLNPFSLKKTKEEKKDTWSLWFKVIVAVLPSAVLGLIVDGPLDEFLRGTSLLGTNLNVIVVAAALILADKSDVRRSRVRNRDLATFDIHDRVNYSVENSDLKISDDRTRITLYITIDTQYCSIMDYFEIFLVRMTMCRRAAEKLGLKFKLEINGQELL